MQVDRSTPPGDSCRDTTFNVSNFLQMCIPQALSFSQIFEPSAYPADMDEMLFWGNRHLETLLEHYGSRQENTDGDMFDALVDTDTCRGEFLPAARIHPPRRGNDLESSHPTDGQHLLRHSWQGEHPHLSW